MQVVVFVQDTIYDKFVARAVEEAKKAVVGSPNDSNTSQGPQVDSIQFDRVMSYIESGKADASAGNADYSPVVQDMEIKVTLFNQLFSLMFKMIVKLHKKKSSAL